MPPGLRGRPAWNSGMRKNDSETHQIKGSRGATRDVLRTSAPAPVGTGVSAPHPKSPLSSKPSHNRQARPPFVPLSPCLAHRLRLHPQSH
eukprot:366567-Chlamydomonas_euryale.AAC.11